MLTRQHVILKVLLGVLTFWPPLYMLIFLVFFIGTFSSVFTGSATEPPQLLTSAFPVIMVLHLSTILLSFVLLTVYIVDLFKTDRITDQQKTLWAIVLFLGSLLAMPIYWVLYVWRAPSPREQR
jgi:hypothetical protein